MAIVLYSGGCDSTLVLYDEIKKLERKEGDYTSLLAISVNHEQVNAHDESKKARERFKEELKRRDLLDYVNFLEIDITHGGDSGVGLCTGSCGLAQPLIWLHVASMYSDSGEDIICGYHAGDDFWSKSYQCQEAITNISAVLGKRQTNVIIAPFQHLRKVDILKRLKELGLYTCCWYCENPVNGKECGKCIPCQTHITGLWQIGRFLTVRKTGFEYLDCKESDVGTVDGS